MLSIWLNESEFQHTIPSTFHIKTPHINTPCTNPSTTITSDMGTQPPPASTLVPLKPRGTCWSLCPAHTGYSTIAYLILCNAFNVSGYPGVWPLPQLFCGRSHHTFLQCTSRCRVRRPPAPRSRAAVKRPPPSRSIQHQRPAAAPQYRPRDLRNGTPARRQQPRQHNFFSLKY